jgi:WD40 repeat protein/serine/threonine protein kinase
MIKVFRSGGMGQITLVHDNHLGRDIALKTLLPDRVQNASKNRTRTGAPTMELLTVPIIARFLQEAHITGQLEHPSIIPIYEMGYKNDGTLYYTMMYVRGLSIEEKLKEAKDLKDRLLLLTHFLDMCQAMAYAHSRGVIHRDLKPMNVMVGKYGETIVIDWGIAKVKGEVDINAKDLSDNVKVLQVGDTQATAKTMYGQTIGSPFYMPPEQAAGKTDQVDERADIYALGAILYVILTGQPPYHGMNVREFLVKVQQFDPKPVLEVEKQAPKELAAIVAKAMQRKREDRYQTSGELASEVEKFLSGGLVSAYEYSAAELFKRWYKRNRVVVNLTLAASVLLLAVGVWSYFAIREQRDIAVANEIEATRQKRAAREELYFANVNLGQNAMGDRLPDKAREQLKAAPSEFYNWEWGFVQHEANADAMTLKSGGQNVGYGDGIIVAAASFGKTEVYDAATGALLHTLFEQKAGTGYAFAFSAASSRVALLGVDGVHVWDAKSGAEIYRFEETVSGAQAQALGIRQLTLSADGARLAMLGADKTARVVDLDTKAEVYTTTFEQYKGAVVDLSEDGKRLLLIKPIFGAEGFEQHVEVIDLASGTALGSTVAKDPAVIHATALTTDGGILALGMTESIQVYTTSPFQQVQQINGPRFQLPDTLALTADGRHVAGGTDDGDVGVWDVATGKYAYASKAHNDKIRQVQFAATGNQLFSASGDRTVKLWEVGFDETPALRMAHTFLGHDGAIFGLDLSPNGTRMASTAFDGRTKVWDLKAEMAFFQPAALEFQPEREWTAGALGKDVALWDARTDYRLATMTGHSAEVDNVAFSTDGTHLASLAINKDGDLDELTVWSLPGGEPAGKLNVPKKVEQFTPLQAGTRLLARQGGALRVYTLSDGTVSPDVKASGPYVLDAKGERAAFAAATEEKGVYQVQVLTLADGATTTVHTIASVDVPLLAFDNQGQSLAAGQWEKPDADANVLSLHLIPLGGGAPSVVKTAFENKITSLALSNDGQMVAVGGSSGDIEIYDTAAKTLKLTLDNGHKSRVASVAFSPDASRLASASYDGTFLLWDVAGDRQVITVHNEALQAKGQNITPDHVAFNTKGDLMATITSGTLTAPYVNKAFPWKLDEYPAGEELQDRVEAYKRSASAK